MPVLLNYKIWRYFLKATQSLFLVLLFLISSNVSAVEFKQLKRYSEVPDLPPKLKLVFELACDEHLISFLRKDIVNKKSNEVFIYVGGIAYRSFEPCMGYGEHSIDAGYLYSGRKYRVFPLN